MGFEEHYPIQTVIRDQSPLRKVEKKMLHDSTSLRVIDLNSGLPLMAMRFFTVLAALDYLERSSPKCTACGSSFHKASIHSISSCNGAWQVRFPHDCKPQSAISSSK